MNKIDEFINATKEICEPQGFDKLIVLTHAWHETGGFNHIIGNNNFWGIKTPLKSVWHGLTKEVLTHEHIPKKVGENEIDAKGRAASIFSKRIANISAVTINQKEFWKVYLIQTFRDWGTCKEAVAWYCDFIRLNYTNAYENRCIFSEYFKTLVSGKPQYATDPAYTDKCIRLYKELQTKFFH